MAGNVIKIRTKTLMNTVFKVQVGHMVYKQINNIISNIKK